MLDLPTSIVRDLAWACFSSPLVQPHEIVDEGQALANCGLTLTPHRKIWLTQLEADPSALRAWLGSSPPRRLGLYVERLWHFFLEQDPSVEFVAHNVPVRGGGRTLGEFDCLYYCYDRERYFHLELAAKFYLGVAEPGPASWHQWWGPNTADRLDLKLGRMLEHQTRLGEQPAGRQVLRELGIDELACEAEIKGYLYQPYNMALPMPRGCSTAAQGLWVHASEVEELMSAHAAQYWQLLDRMAWLAPAASLITRHAHVPCSKSATLTALREHFQVSERPVQIAGFEAGTHDVLRVFVVPDNWPMGN